MKAISAHRGGTERFASGTYEAYRDAAASGVEFVEVDVRRLRDGSLVVMHDEPDDVGYDELCTRAGYEVPLYPRVVAGLPASVKLHLDLKETGYEEEVVDLAAARGGYVATSLEHESLRRIRALYPDAPTALSLGRGLRGMPLAAATSQRWNEFFPDRRLAACGAHGVALNVRLARLGALRHAARRGLDVLLWTVDADPDLARYLADPRVGVVVTNRPHAALALRRLT